MIYEAIEPISVRHTIRLPDSEYANIQVSVIAPVVPTAILLTCKTIYHEAKSYIDKAKSYIHKAAEFALRDLPDIIFDTLHQQNGTELDLQGLLVYDILSLEVEIGSTLPSMQLPPSRSQIHNVVTRA